MFGEPTRRFGLVVMAIMIVGTLGSGLGAAQSADGSVSEPAFMVSLEQDGDATVSLVVVYDLANDDEQAAFEQLQENPTALTTEFEDRLTRLANRTAAESGREMTVSNVSAETSTVDSTGVVWLSATWTNLAMVDGEQLVLSEPFASGFQPDRTFVVTAPDSHVIDETSHEPIEKAGGTATWSSGTDLSGFSMAVSTDEVSGGTLPTTLTTLLSLGVLTALGYAGWRLIGRR